MIEPCVPIWVCVSSWGPPFVRCPCLSSRKGGLFRLSIDCDGRLCQWKGNAHKPIRATIKTLHGLSPHSLSSWTFVTVSKDHFRGKQKKSGAFWPVHPGSESQLEVGNRNGRVLFSDGRGHHFVMASPLSQSKQALGPFNMDTLIYVSFFRLNPPNKCWFPLGFPSKPKGCPQKQTHLDGSVV